MKICRRVLFPAFTGLLIFVLTTIPVLAAEAADQDPVATTMGVFFRWLNFAIVFGGIAYLISKKGGAFFGANAKAIAAKITEATATKASADAELHEVQAKIVNLDREVMMMWEEAAREAAIEAARLRESARVEIEKIKQAAQVELIASERAARQELRGVAASLAVQRAGVVVSSRMTPDIRARLFRTFLGEIGGSKN
jgi:F0F1-type ATP synthase membrane subunit b/b'